MTRTTVARFTFGLCILALGMVGGRTWAATPPATSLNTCQQAVNVATKQFISSKVNALSVCLQAVSTQIVKKNAGSPAAAAAPCVTAFRKLSDSRVGKQLSDKLQAAIVKKCAPGQPNVTHTLGDILGAGAGVAQPLDAGSLNAWCSTFGGDGSLDTLTEWIDCIIAAAECSVDTALASQYPRLLEWLTLVRPAMLALAPPKTDPTKISDAVAGLDAVKAEIDGPDNDNVISIQCIRPASTPTNTPVPTPTPGGCLGLGAACAAAQDCCDGVCTGGVCAYPACTSDGHTCASNAACCSGICSGGTCGSLNGACLTLGNACTQSSDCCSSLCQNGICAVSSYCTQSGDVCSTAADCCSGTCSVAAGATRGTCAPLSNGVTSCSGLDGSVCDSALTCGANCCSGLCAPYGPTGVAICQPASGCHAAGDLCTRDADCCGASGLPGGAGVPVTCSISAGATVGVCRAPQGCKPDGDLCKLDASCNGACDCCSGNCQNMDTCKPDLSGVPRCAAAQCVAAGGACASSANCCNSAPCVPNPSGTPPFVCLASTCAGAGQPCTADADCCGDTTCTVSAGSTLGTCAPSLGTPTPTSSATPAPTNTPPGSKNNGAGCTSSAECLSSHCVPVTGGGSVCCPTDCPDSGANACGSTGVCALSGAGCILYPSGTACQAPSCSGSTFMAQPTCNGAGSCNSPASAACAHNLSCANASNCATSCTPGTTTNCADVLHSLCNAAGTVCQFIAGFPCTTNSDCLSGACSANTCL